MADVDGDGHDDLITANEATDRVTVQPGRAGDVFAQGPDDGLLAPGAVEVADLNGDGIPDILLANSGANSVLVYLGIGKGKFEAARSFSAGTTPVSLTRRRPLRGRPARRIEESAAAKVVFATWSEASALLSAEQGCAQLA